MPAFVLDCSVAASWLFEDERTPALVALQEQLRLDSAAVPWLWFLEIANALHQAERRGRVGEDQILPFLEFIGRIELEVDSEAARRAFDFILPLCRGYALTAYDAAYLDLAIRRSLPLATLDDDLRRAAKKAGVALLGR